MKKLSIEEKAKRYDEAIEIARKLKDEYNDIEGCYPNQWLCEELFPELTESDDERIRKVLLNDFKNNCSEYYCEGVNRDMIIAWLEKQGEQKPNPCDGCINRKGCINCENGELRETEHKPADKVERKGMNIVEEDMTHFQKKVFCIIDTTIEEEQGLKQVCDELLRLAHDEIMQKTVWNEEDENHVNSLLKRLEGLCRNEFAMTRFAINEDVDWLKSLKDRVQPQSKQKWSEDDEKMVGNIRSIIEKYAFSQSAVDVNGNLCEKEYIDADNWLKSLRPQNRWKPSDEQIKALESATENCAYSDYQDCLRELIEQLKKLKE